MNPYQFLRELAGLPTGASPGGGGDGIRVERNIFPDLRTSAGLALTAATAPAIVAVETNALAVQAIATSNPLGSFVFEVPKDYDPSRDELSIRLWANSAGVTDSPIITCTAFRKRVLTALSTALTVVPSAAVLKTGATVSTSELTVGLSGNSLKPGDQLTINLSTGGHTTDAINLYGASIVYRSNLVFTDMATR